MLSGGELFSIAFEVALPKNRGDMASGSTSARSLDDRRTFWGTSRPSATLTALRAARRGALHDVRSGPKETSASAMTTAGGSGADAVRPKAPPDKLRPPKHFRDLDGCPQGRLASTPQRLAKRLTEPPRPLSRAIGWPELSADAIWLTGKTP